ncbi:MAG: phosphoglycerate kinase [Bacillota bacterium]
MRGIKKIPKLANVPVLVRAALNVPVENGTVTNTFRLRQALPTIEYLQNKGARVILCGHIGDLGTETFEPVYQALKPLIPRLEFCPVSVGKEAREAVRSMRAGDVLLLENLRRHRGEKANDPEFARELASLADVFVEDSFDVCHRKHASVVGVPELLPAYAGLLLEREITELKKALNPKRPAVAIIAGAKFATKEPVIVSLLRSYSHVFIGGAIANDFIQAQGHLVGTSLTSAADPREIRTLLGQPQLITPRDVVVAPLGATREAGTVVDIGQIPSDQAVLDIGPASIESLAPYIKKAKTILWNGTLGQYEHGFIEATESLAHLITATKARTVLGGGDTVAAVEALGLAPRFSFVSTGGGAMLDFLAYGTLPGISVLK